MGWVNCGSLGRGRPFSVTPRKQEVMHPQLLDNDLVRPVVFVARIARTDTGADNVNAGLSPQGDRGQAATSTK